MVEREGETARFELDHGLHRVFDWRLEVDAVDVVQVYRIDSQTIQAALASLLHVGGVGADFVILAVRLRSGAHGAAELAGQEYLVALAGPLEPLTEQIL